MTLIFKLDITCKLKPGATDDAPEEEKYIGSRGTILPPKNFFIRNLPESK
jgi:hypothetical protein